jgi:acyl-CoA thioester hydrolase
MSELKRLAEWKVAENEIDHLGHMNMQFYGRRAEQGCAGIFKTLGLGAGELDGAGLITAAVDQHTMYRREQLVNSSLSIAGGVAAADANQITVYQEMSNDVTGDLAATFLFTLQLKDRATRHSITVPDAAVRAATVRLVKAPARSQPRSVPLGGVGAHLTIDDFVRAGVESHVRREIEAKDCDEYGFLTSARPYRMPPNTRQSQGVMDLVWGSVEGFAWPALEARTLTRKSARNGDVLDTYTALLSVTHKIIQWGAWTFEARSKELVSVNQQANIFFDVTARQTHDMPTDVRARLSTLARPELLPKQR